MIPDLVPDCESDFYLLLDKISQNNCCAFIGAGISQRAGYPSWNELLTKMEDFLREGGVDVKYDPSLPNENKLDNIRMTIGNDKFIEGIFTIFNNHDKEECVNFHRFIVNIPFQSYITTNFDYCLENAANLEERNPIPEVYILPGFSSKDLRNGNIFHIHGVIYPQNPYRYAGSLVLTTQDYDEVYGSEFGSGLIRLLFTLFQDYTVVFMGYSLRDSYLINLLNRARKELQRQQEYTVNRNLGIRKIPEHFIFLHEREKSEWEKTIKDWGLIPLFYTGDTKRHMGLERLLSEVQRKLSRLSYPRLVPNRSMFEDEHDV